MNARGPRMAEDLRHENRDHAFCRIRRPGRTVATVPAVPPGYRRHIVTPGDDRDAEAPAVAVPEAGEELRHGLLLRGDLIRGHRLHGEPRQDPPTPPRSPVQHHLAEVAVV